MRLDAAQFDLSRLDRQLRSEAAAGALISAQLPRDIAALAMTLRSAGSALRPLGSREAILGAAFIEVSGDFTAFAAELQQAHTAGARADSDARWIQRFMPPTQLVRAAYDVLDSASPWG